MDKPQTQAANGDLITDDFAPADVYDVIGKDMRWRKSVRLEEQRTELAGKVQLPSAYEAAAGLKGKCPCG